jgi:hypothetical protein
MTRVCGHAGCYPDRCIKWDGWEDSSPLSPIRGILIGLVISAAIWAVLVAAWSLLR